MIDEEEEIEAQDARVAQVFGTKEPPRVSRKNLLKYRQYLLERLDPKTVLVGTEDFPWEEKYVFGYGSKSEYQKMKKTNLSYTDECVLLSVSEDDVAENDLIAEVKRLSDGQIFDERLSWLAAKDKGPDWQLLDDFSSWAVNC